MTTGAAPIFIVGTQRSGSTLLRLILNAHPEIAIPEEARFLTPLLNKNNIKKPIEGQALSRLVNYLRANEQFRLWNFDAAPFLNELAVKSSVMLAEVINAMFSSFAQSEGKSLWGDKSLFFGSVQLLHELFPGARFIHIVRDGRDVFDSWRKMDASKNHPTAMALDWHYKLRSIERALAKLPSDRALTLRYEDLVASPDTVVRSICRFLGIAFEPAMLEFHKTSGKYIGEHHSRLIFGAIDPSNTAKWRKHLSSDDVRLYELMAANHLRHYGYELSGTSTSMRQILLAVGDLLVGLPQRAWQIGRARLAYRRALVRGEATKTISVGAMPKNSGPERPSDGPK
ncbi:MAG: hypothetical protein A2W25_00995 [candidate division Zixibacteria bacterium RBG_16_53_22]|nr:MAG: hypothetical protein A2W25_00995 [candidate division Zixibacteria bacterium RBG_16_53_22]